MGEDGMDSDWSDSLVDDSDNLGAYILSESRRPLHATQEECEMAKSKLVSDLRIGSVLDIGEKFPPLSAFGSGRGRKDLSRPTPPLKYARIGYPTYFSPISLLLAREQGDCGPSSRYYRLRDFYSSRVSKTEDCDERPRWPSNQSFQQHIQGSLWSVSSFGLSAVYQHHTGCVNALNFNHSGHLIASASDDTCVAIADSYTGELKTRFLTGHTLNVFQVKFVPNHNDLKLVTSARDGMVRLAELHPGGQTARTTRTLTTHQDACRSIVLVPEEPTLLLTAGEDGSVFSIDLRINQPEQLLHLPLSPFYSISANPARPVEFCVSGKYESVVRVFDRRKLSVASPKDGYLHSFAPRHLLSKWQRRQCNRFDSPEAASEVDCMADETRVDNAPDDSEASDYDDRVDSDESDFVEEGFFSSRLGRQLLSLLRDDSRSRNRAPSPPELGGATAESHIGQRRWSRNRPVRLNDRVDPLGDHSQTKYSITSAVYSSNGDAILASFNDEDIYLFYSQDDKLPPLHVYRGHRNNDSVKGVNFYGPNSEFVMSGSDDGFIYVWDRNSEGIVQWLCGDVAGAVNVLEPHPFCPMLATSGCDYNIKIWTPIGQRGNIGRPETWLKGVRDVEPSQRLLFDPGDIVESMQSLRRSSLAKNIFGEDEDFQPSDEDFSPTVDGDGDAHDSSDVKTTIQRKRKSLEVDNDTASVSVRFSKRYKKVKDSPNQGNRLPVAAAPQKHLPFNSKDLQLRVAANWAGRNRDSLTVTFAFGLPEFLRPALQVTYDIASHRMTDFLRRRHSTNMSDDSSDDEVANGRGHLGEVVEPAIDHISDGDGGDNTSLSTFSSSSTSESTSSSSIAPGIDPSSGAQSHDGYRCD
ncbi:DDB1 and CUL4-associated factor 8 [Taenia crassiceps]|uniref:DDB1 and CUL4-associated factor 8 n=1 Tax=Taenia crassiceps TaxID=6207 RepID=A0ABR4QMT0_9CEST